MKFHKYALKIFSILLIFTLIFSFLTFVYADEEEDPEELLEEEDSTSITYVTDSGESHYSDSDLFLFEDVIKIDYPVSGNVFAMGKSITISSSVDGNVFVFTDELNITKDAYITNDLFAAAKNVRIAGYVSNLYCATNILSLEEGGYVTRDAYCSAEEVNLTGYIRRNAHIASDSINITNPVQAIGGNLDYYSSRESEFTPTSVSGEIIHHKENSSGASFKDFFINLIQSLAYSVIVIFIFLMLEKKVSKVDKVKEKLNIKKIVLKGLLGLVCIPICLIVLLITVVGIPVALALFVIYCLAISITTGLVSLKIAEIICNKYKIPDTLGKKLLVGSCSVLAILLLSSIPFVGWIISLAQAVLGFGIIADWFLSFFCKKQCVENKEDKKIEKKDESKEVDKAEKKNKNKDNK